MKWFYVSIKREHVESLPYIEMNGSDIEKVTQAKVLGVTISSDLRWNAHVDEIVSRQTEEELGGEREGVDSTESLEATMARMGGETGTK